jgi:opacity protein-like surface antigen
MKKIIAILAVAATCMVAANSAKAIDDQWSKGTMVVGAMFGYYPGIGGSITGDYVLVDSWWKGHFTVGAQINYRYWNPAGSYYTYNDLAVSPRATYGLNITSKFEVHAGFLAGLGAEFSRYKNGGILEKEKHLGLCWGPILGCRFFFSDVFGVQAETNYTGYGPYLNVGVAFKF